MPKVVYVSGVPATLDLDNPRAEGGEARLYEWTPEEAIRLFIPPSDPLYDDDRSAKRIAQGRIAEFQRKYGAFPTGLPGSVLMPGKKVTESAGDSPLIGHTIRFVANASTLRDLQDPAERVRHGHTNQSIVALFRRIAESVAAVHRHGMVIGDFNPQNCLVRGAEHFLIDTASYQLTDFPCTTFTPGYVDPLLCEEVAGGGITLKYRHNALGDWYSYWILLFESLFQYSPYRGIYRPDDPKKGVAAALYPIHGISVFHPKVKLPPSLPRWDRLPDEAIDFYRGLVERRERVPFTTNILDSMKWVICPTCGVEHARIRCPGCSLTVAASQVVRSQYRVSTVASVPGRFLAVLVDGGGSELIRYVHADGNVLFREDGRTIGQFENGKIRRVRMRNADTVVGLDDSVNLITESGAVQPIAVDRYRGEAPMFDTNARHLYWLNGGRLYRDDPKGPVAIAAVLRHQTRIWVGSHFGLGFFRSGRIQRAFLFDAVSEGEIVVDLPSLQGRILEMQCYFTSSRVWLVVALERHGTILRRCFAIASSGRVLGEASGDDTAGSWLRFSTGKVAGVELSTTSGKAETPFLLSATDDDVVRLQVVDRQIVQVSSFAGTADFAGAQDQLLFSPRGLYVVTPREVRLMSAKRGPE